MDTDKVFFAIATAVALIAHSTVRMSLVQSCSRLWTAFSPLGLVVLSAGLTDVSAADAENPLPQILRDWEKRRQDVAMVAYKFSGTRTWHQGGMRPVSEPYEDSGPDENPPFGLRPGEEKKVTVSWLPTQDIVVPCDYDVTLDFHNNRCRLLRDDATAFPIDGNPALVERYKVLEVGDAGACSCHIIENTSRAIDKQPQPLVNFMIQRGDIELIPPSSFHDSHYWPLFFGSGVVPTGDQRVKAVLVAPTNDAGAFIFEGYGTEQGRRCVVLRVEYRKRYSTTTRYWIDVEHDSSVIKYTVELGDLLTTCSITNGLATGRWLPQSWFTTSVRGRKLQRTEAMMVARTTLFTNISSDVFVLKPTEGMFVQEYEYYREPVTRDRSYRMRRYRLASGGERAEQSGRFYHHNEETGRIREGDIR